MTCVKCGKPVSQEDMDKRYRELIDMGIAPMIVVMCEACRTFNRKVNEQATKMVYGE
jgi:hypothetical protein